MWYKETGGSMLTSTAISKDNCPQYRNLYRKIYQAFIDLSLVELWEFSTREAFSNRCRMFLWVDRRHYPYVQNLLFDI